jgi:protoheme IX farnesyltransferase
MYREDYSRAGILMLPVVEPDGRVTAQQIVVYTLMLIPVSLLPTVLGVSGESTFLAHSYLASLSLQQCSRGILHVSSASPAIIASFRSIFAIALYPDGGK